MIAIGKMTPDRKEIEEKKGQTMVWMEDPRLARENGKMREDMGNSFQNLSFLTLMARIWMIEFIEVIVTSNWNKPRRRRR